MTPEEIVSALMQSPVQMSWLAAAMALAPLLGKAANMIGGGRAKARVAEAGLNAHRDNQSLDFATSDQANKRANLNSDMDFTNDAQSRARRAALLEGMQDFTVSRPGGRPSRISGGMRPSAIAGGSAMGRQFKGTALADLAKGANLNRSTTAMTPLPRAGKLDKMLNLIGLIGGAAGLAGKIKNGIGGEDAEGDEQPGTYRAPTFTRRF